MIDADPNKPLSRWAKLPESPKSSRYCADITEESIIDAIEKAALQTTSSSSIWKERPR